MLRFVTSTPRSALSEADFQSIKRVLFNDDDESLFDMDFMRSVRTLMAANADDPKRMVASFSDARINELAIKFIDFYSLS